MEWLLSTMAIGLLAFVTTNVDDLLLLVLLFSLTNFRKRHVVIGQYLGFIVIITLSSLASFGKWVVPLKWIGFLGLVPIALGLREMRRLIWKQKLTYEILHLEHDAPASFVRTVLRSLLSPQIYSVAVMTIGNGSDNIATYIPLFAAGDLTRMGVLISFFLLLVGLWSYIGHALASHPTIARIIEQFGHIFLPFIFIMLGILIMIETGVIVLRLREWLVFISPTLIH